MWITFDVLKQCKLNILILFLSEICWINGNKAVFLTASKKLEWWHVFGCFRTSLVQTLYDDREYWILRFNTSLIDLDLDSRSQVCKKAKTSTPIQYAVETCWSNKSHAHSINIQGREPYLCDFVTKLAGWLAFEHWLTSVFQTLCDDKDDWNQHFDASLTFMQGHSCKRNQKLLHIFSCNFLNTFESNVVCCHNLLVCGISW